MNPKLIRLFMVPLACIFFWSSSLSFAADRATIEAAKKEGKIVIYIVYPRSFLPQIKEDFRKTFQLGDDFNIDFTLRYHRFTDTGHFGLGDLSWLELGMLFSFGG